MMHEKKPKIVFIHPDLGIGGAERLVLDVAVALSEKHEVSFVTNHFNKNHAFEELRNGQFPVRVIGNWIPRGIFGIFQALFSYIRMVYLAIFYIFFISKNEKPDIFFIDQIPMAVPFIKWAGGKVIYYCHHPDLLASTPGGFFKRLYRLPIDWLELKGTAMSDVILVNSKYTAKVFQQTFPQIRQNVYIVYPTISSSYQALVANNQLKKIDEISHLPKETFIFLSINRFHPAKKLELAMDAFESVQSKLSSTEWNNIHLIMAGGYDPDSSINDSYFAKLVKLCEDKNLMSKVTFLKSPSDALKADLLLRCNCLIYTPINEHFGIVPLEAMTAGKPVIACNSGGPCETVLDGITGYLCDPTGDALADAISTILRYDNAAKMGLMGKNRLQLYFSYENFSNRVNGIVNDTIHGKKPSDNIIENELESQDINVSYADNQQQTDSVEVAEKNQQEDQQHESTDSKAEEESQHVGQEESNNSSTDEKNESEEQHLSNVNHDSQHAISDDGGNLSSAVDQNTNFISTEQMLEAGPQKHCDNKSPMSSLSMFMQEERINSYSSPKNKNGNSLNSSTPTSVENGNESGDHLNVSSASDVNYDEDPSNSETSF